jgi:hypothetical protein
MTSPSTPDQVGPVTSVFTDVLLTSHFIDLIRHLERLSALDSRGEGIDARELYAKHDDSGYGKQCEMTRDLVTMMRMGPLTVSGKSFADFAKYNRNNGFCFTGTIRYDRSK